MTSPCGESTRPPYPGQSVWIPDRSEEAQVLNEAGPRSYEVLTHDGGCIAEIEEH